MSKLEIDRGTQVARADRVLESVRAIVNALLHPGPPPPPWPRVALIVLTATLLLAPNGTRTLAMQFWSHTNDLDYAQAAPYALLMVGLSLPVTLLLFRSARLGATQ